MNETKGMATCCVCGRDFALIAEEHYVAQDIETNGISSIIAKKDAEMFDAFDCPHCGCQNIMQVRKKYAVCGELTIECQYDDTEYSRCDSCKHKSCKYCMRGENYERRESDGVKEIRG